MVSIRPSAKCGNMKPTRIVVKYASHSMGDATISAMPIHLYIVKSPSVKIRHNDPHKLFTSSQDAMNWPSSGVLAPTNMVGRSTVSSVNLKKCHTIKPYVNHSYRFKTKRNSPITIILQHPVVFTFSAPRIAKYCFL